MLLTSGSDAAGDAHAACTSSLGGRAQAPSRRCVPAVSLLWSTSSATNTIGSIDRDLARVSTMLIAASGSGASQFTLLRLGCIALTRARFHCTCCENSINSAGVTLHLTILDISDCTLHVVTPNKHGLTKTTTLAS